MLSLTETKLIDIFIKCDDFLKDFQPWLEQHTLGRNQKPNSALVASEIITLCIAYHFSRKDRFKSFYQQVALKYLKIYFPDMPCYEHFVNLKKFYLFEMAAFLLTRLDDTSAKVNFIDSKKLPSCHIKREHAHKVMKGLASKGKASVGWFFGLKLHLIINDSGRLCRFMVTGGSVSDNNHEVLKTLFKDLKGVFYGDKGYLSRLKEWLYEQGVILVAKPKENMKKAKAALSKEQKHYLKHRGLIETVFGLLSFQADIDHTRHRSQSGMFLNLFSGLLAYTFFDVLPRLNHFLQDPDIELF